MDRKNIITTGCALFAMLFGAGNIVFPLILGRSLGTFTPYALMGFILTAVLIPLVGFISVMLASGQQALFLGKLGRILGMIIGLLCMTLLGPLGATPRCIAIAHADLSWYLPGLNIWIFSACACLGIWLFTYDKSRVIEHLGKYLGPLKIICLLAIAILGLFYPGTPITPEAISETQSFMKGFYDGYGTMDLLAIIFFSGMIYGRLQQTKNPSKKELMKKALSVSLICGLLLTLVYAGFAGIAAIHGPSLNGIADDTLLSALASIILGPKAGVFANLTIALTCFVTAIALSATFAEFISRDVFAGRISYRLALGITIALSGVMATLRFTGIMSTIMPLISLCYPALMVFAFLHILLALGWLKLSYARSAFILTVSLTALSSWFF
jgi:LIVCS family branched-chain amino acid:cation transporter